MILIHTREWEQGGNLGMDQVPSHFCPYENHRVLKPDGMIFSHHRKFYFPSSLLDNLCWLCSHYLPQYTDLSYWDSHLSYSLYVTMKSVLWPTTLWNLNQHHSTCDPWCLEFILMYQIMIYHLPLKNYHLLFM